MGNQLKLSDFSNVVILTQNKANIPPMGENQGHIWNWPFPLGQRDLPVAIGKYMVGSHLELFPVVMCHVMPTKTAHLVHLSHWEKMFWPMIPEKNSSMELAVIWGVTKTHCNWNIKKQLKHIASKSYSDWNALVQDKIQIIWNFFLLRMQPNIPT